MSRLRSPARNGNGDTKAAECFRIPSRRPSTAPRRSTGIMKETEEDEPGLRCPCGSANVAVFYTAPLMFRCRTCKRDLYDVNDKGIPVLTQEEAMSKRPGMYGLPFCHDCGHAVHESFCLSACKWCEAPKKHVYDLRYAKKSDCRIVGRAWTRLRKVARRRVRARRGACVGAAVS